MSYPSVTKEVAQRAVELLELTNGNTLRAAALAGVGRATFQNRIARAKQLYGLEATRGASEESDGVKKHLAHLEAALKQLKQDNARLREDSATSLRLKALIHECDEYVSKPPTWLIEPKRAHHNTGVPSMMLSDIHWDEVVDPRQINGVNQYNRVIATRRLRTFFSAGVELWKHHVAHPTYDYLVVPMGGDLLSGTIHDELRETNEAPIALSVMSLVDVLIAGFTLLAEAFGKVYVPCVCGNHGRLDKKPRAKNRAFDNFEFFVYHFLARHFAGDDRLHFEIAEGPDLYYQVYWMTYLLTHGDQFRGGTGISGAFAPLMLGDHRKRKRAMSVQRPYHMMLMGHWHQLLKPKGIIVNGSVKGYDEWADQQNFDFEEPRQASWLTHAERGITCEWPIMLEKPGTRY